MKLVAVIVMSVMMLVALMGRTQGVVARGVAADTPQSVAVVQAFYDALNARDFDKARSLVAPDLVFDFDPGTDNALTQTLEDQIPGITDHDAHFTILNTEEVSPGVAQVTLTISASDLDELHLAHPYTTTDTAHVQEGKIVSYLGHTSDQTFADLRAVGALPGMPTTGAGDNDLFLTMLALGGGLLLLGLVVRRVRLTNTNPL